jgi:hypothetical protein
VLDAGKEWQRRGIETTFEAMRPDRTIEATRRVDDIDRQYIVRRPSLRVDPYTYTRRRVAARRIRLGWIPIVRLTSDLHRRAGSHACDPALANQKHQVSPIALVHDRIAFTIFQALLHLRDGLPVVPANCRSAKRRKRKGVSGMFIM